MAVALDTEEFRLAKELELKGLGRSAAILAIIMVTRAHARPEPELVEILRQYPSLESSQAVRHALLDLKRRRWIITVTSYGVQLTQQAPDLRVKIANEIGDPLIAEQLLAMRASLEPYVSVVGSMTDERVYTSFMDLLRNAQREICLPMLATTPYPETVAILQDRARAGVRVRILLGAPDLVARWRGEHMRKLAEQRISEWKRKLGRLPTVQIRIAHNAPDMELASCVAIDKRITRLDIYDPYTQRSLEGVMVEIVSPPGLPLNGNRLFQRAFDIAWSRGFTVGRLSRLVWVLRRWWKIWLALITLAAALLPVPLSAWSQILVGISVGILAPAIIDEAPGLWTFISRRLVGHS